MEIARLAIGSEEDFDDVRNQFYKWDSFNAELLKRLFTSAELSEEYSWFGAIAIGGRQSLGAQIAELHNDINKKIHRIDSILDRLELIPIAQSVAIPAYGSNSITEHSRHMTKKVFVVHGRDEIAKTNLEVFLLENGLEPVVLHRQADEGMTIIEKFEKHSDVGYAFILLTPDEIAYLAHDDAKPDGERNKEFRARPNVIFEFGYFVAKLGRPRVCCLYTGNVSIPSDLSGLVYKRYDKTIEEVAYPILKDLRASGYSV